MAEIRCKHESELAEKLQMALNENWSLKKAIIALVLEKFA